MARWQYYYRGKSLLDIELGSVLHSGTLHYRIGHFTFYRPLCGVVCDDAQPRETRAAEATRARCFAVFTTKTRSTTYKYPCSLLCTNFDCPPTREILEGTVVDTNPIPIRLPSGSLMWWSMDHFRSPCHDHFSVALLNQTRYEPEPSNDIESRFS